VTVRDIPNLITFLRFLLVPPVVYFLSHQEFGSALLLFVLAGFSDALDGFLAKRFGWTSRLGEMMDPLADKLLLICSYVTLGWLGLLPVWLVGVVILRDVVIVTGATVYHLLIERLDAKPTMISKLNTLAQIMLVLLVVLGEVGHTVPASWVWWLILAVMITTLWSGLGYVWIWGRKALARGRHARS
jgi:cardiolipin synthase